MQNLGFQPIKLGPDLRGGAVSTDVDVDPVYQTQGEALVDSLRQFIREQKIRGASVYLDQTNQLNLTLPDNDARAAVRQMMKQSIQIGNYPIPMARGFTD